MQEIVKWSIRLAIFLGALLISISISTGFYATVYWLVIPKVAHERPLQLNYTTDSPAIISSFVDFSAGSFKQLLSSSQAYDVNLELLLPTSPHNQHLGNFMIQLQLLNVAYPKNMSALNMNDEDEYVKYVQEHGETVYRVNRAAILPFKSYWVSLVETVASIPLVITEFTQEAKLLKIPMLTNLYDSYYKPITHGIFTIRTHGDSPLQIYSSTLRVDAHFSGIRYLMYYLSLPSAIVFISISTLVMMFAFCIAWIYYLLTLSEDADEVPRVSFGYPRPSQVVKRPEQLPTPPPELILPPEVGYASSDEQEEELEIQQLRESSSDSEQESIEGMESAPSSPVNQNFDFGYESPESEQEEQNENDEQQEQQELLVTKLT